MVDTNTNTNGDSESLSHVVEQLDTNTAAGLREIVQQNPELLKETLNHLGYLSDPDGELLTNEEAPELSEAQARISKALQNMGNPRTTEEIVDLFKRDYPEIIEEFQSAKHRPWMSTQLKQLVERGVLGRFRDGRTVRYTPEPTEAVRHWALHNNRFVEELERNDARQIAEDTDMPLRTVRESIDQISESS
jgi:predicted transcriptional regulator